MIVYNQYEDTVTHWPEPIEQSWQMLPAVSTKLPRSPIAGELASKMPHLGLADILFLAAVVHVPQRPYGAITWVADFYRISRVSVYKLGERVASRLTKPTELLSLPEPVEKETVSKAKIDRTILTSLFPGNASIRPTIAILKEALDTLRSVGYISDLRLEAGQRAGAVLSRIDYTPLGPLIALRDETFFQGRPMLLLIDPISTVIVAAYVCSDRQSDTWALVLLMAEEQGVALTGLTEDMAKMYGKSLKLAGMAAKPQQKDVWHLERDGATIRRSLERAAYREMAKVIDLEKQLLKKWDDDLFEEKYIPAVAKEMAAIACHDQFETWLTYLHDALALVDIGSGEIRDPATSQWFLEEILTGMEQIEQKQVKKFAKTLRNHQPQLLTFLDWTAAALADYDARLTACIPDAQARLQFIQAVARSWLLDQMLINGHRQWRAEAQKAASLVNSVTDTDGVLAEFALSLRQILDASGRTSSLIEAINSLLKPFFRNRKGFKNQETMQAFLNLFVLWHNMRVYDPRCKRGGKSPFQLAGIDLGSDDWLTLLGYSPVN
ncbi:MAG: hypothetical protein GWP17_03250 [Aquificales bacterium]|nr:hypothetical protein [Aquificales bacterium]